MYCEYKKKNRELQAVMDFVDVPLRILRDIIFAVYQQNFKICFMQSATQISWWSCVCVHKWKLPVSFPFYAEELREKKLKILWNIPYNTANMYGSLVC